ncbi:MAG: alginate O-acetyltransferase AlgF [Pseudomonadota bacterium]
MVQLRPYLARLLALLATGLASAAAAQSDNGLYAPVPDPESSFVRVIAPGASVATVDQVAIDQFDQGVTPYINVDPGQVGVSSDGQTVDVSIAQRSYYTVVVGADGAVSTLSDEITSSPAKADLMFYNLSDIETADLFVPQAKANALTGVEAGSAQSVALKAPLTLDFEVQAEGETIATIPAVELRRREGVTLVVLGSGGDYSAFYQNNSYRY